VVLKIIENKYADKIAYQQYFYPLGSITTYLMIKKYGDKLFDNKTGAEALREKSTDHLYFFLSHELNTSGLSLSQYYINTHNYPKVLEL
jgi:hypothetical protein